MNKNLRFTDDEYQQLNKVRGGVEGHAAKRNSSPGRTPLAAVDDRLGKPVSSPAPSPLSFVVYGQPMAKPRMTRRDKWQKRPCVVKYRDWADLVRLAHLGGEAMTDTTRYWVRDKQCLYGDHDEVDTDKSHKETPIEVVLATAYDAAVQERDELKRLTLTPNEYLAAIATLQSQLAAAQERVIALVAANRNGDNLIAKLCHENAALRDSATATRQATLSPPGREGRGQ